MLKKFLGCGCLIVLLVLGVAAYVGTQTEEGEYLLALIMLYGGVIVAGAAAYDTVPGTVTELNRLDPPTDYSAGSMRFTYTDDDGVERSEFRRIMYSASKFESVEVGDEITVRVCKYDRTVVKLIGYGSHEPGTCRAPEENE